LQLMNRIYGSTYRDIGIIITEWNITYNISFSYWIGKLTLVIARGD
jgi:hypothetical protein